MFVSVNWFYSRRGRTCAPNQVQGCEQGVSVSGVRLERESVFIDTHDAVEDPDFLEAGATLAESSSDFDLKVFLELSLVPV